VSELDGRGRCCKIKPLVYKRPPITGEPPQRYCWRCDRAYDLDTGAQIPNWAWMQIGEVFVRRGSYGWARFS